MIILRTAKGDEVQVNWIGISDLDGTLRLETPETDIPKLFGIFTDPEQTKVLTRIFDGYEHNYLDFSSFKGIEKMANGCTVVWLLPAK